jgi:hypothetical protein
MQDECVWHIDLTASVLCGVARSAHDTEAQHLDPETVELVACRDKGEVKEIVKTHLATSVEDAPPVSKYNPTDL